MFTIIFQMQNVFKGQTMIKMTFHYAVLTKLRMFTVHAMIQNQIK